MKKIALLILSLFLVSCGDDTASPSGLTEITKEGYSINIPSNWDIIEKEDGILPKANVGKIELAVTSKKLVNGFSNNLLILSDDITKLTTSKDYSILNNVGARQDYLNYTELESKTITFADEEESIMYIFEAKYNLDTPKLKFIQSANICNKDKAYFFTIAIPSSVDETGKYEELIKSFKCK